MLSEARAKVGHRLAMHLRVDLFRLRNSTPMVSFTFDDLPKSAVTTGAGMLEAHGARGTFYVSGSLVGADAPDWVAGDADDVVSLHRRGHEIGCHTFSHQRACDLDEAAMMQEIMRNRAYLRALDPSIRVDSFAYPFGYGSYARKYQLRKRIPDLPQHRAGRQRRQRRPAVPARHAADRSRDGSRRDRPRVRRGANQ